jgi:hypothetical protein
MFLALIGAIVAQLTLHRIHDDQLRQLHGVGRALKHTAK